MYSLKPIARAVLALTSCSLLALGAGAQTAPPDAQQLGRVSVSGAAASPAANAAYRPSDRGAMAVGAAVGAFGSDRNRWGQIE